MREWAAQNNIQGNPRGRIKQVIIDRYSNSLCIQAAGRNYAPNEETRAGGIPPPPTLVSSFPYRLKNCPNVAVESAAIPLITPLILQVSTQSADIPTT
ncbi:Lsr2 family DNA-binding protein [Glutamicibacter mishrai]|uniref:Lsr2 family DNA-binding protein n=1 Tax=Glutamicibacter mishrai TaxID=1775880 RepID=UPI003D9AABB3